MQENPAFFVIPFPGLPLSSGYFRLRAGDRLALASVSARV